MQSLHHNSPHESENLDLSNLKISKRNWFCDSLGSVHCNTMTINQGNGKLNMRVSAILFYASSLYVLLICSSFFIFYMVSNSELHMKDVEKNGGCCFHLQKNKRGS